MAEPLTTDIETTPPLQRHQPMKKGFSGLSVTFLFIAAIGLGYVASGLQNGTLLGNVNTLLGKEDVDLSRLQSTYRALSDNFDGSLDKQKLIEGANKGLVDAAGDQYTVFMNEEESKEFDNALTGNIGGGIGVELGMRNSVPTVVRLLRDNPAEKAGLQVGDIVIRINDETTENAELNDIVSKIRGDAGTTVKLTINRSAEEKEFNITREQVNNPSAYGAVQGTVGILTVTRFDDQTGSLARAAATEFKTKGVTSVVLDLRGNGGGYVTAAQALAGIWLDKQLVTTERRSGQVTEELKSTGTPILGGIKTVVLVNKSSASASEIVAGALRDNKAATLIGETTFGKGSVQKLVNLPEGATLKVTVARWFTPAGLNISEKGITPDTIVERTADDINGGKDPQLDAALSSF